MSGAVLLYDGDCGLCNASVGFVLRHERQHTLRFAALQSPFGTAVRARHPELNGIDSVVWFDPGHGGASETTFVRSEAALRVAEYLGGGWRLALAARVIPLRWRDAMYDVIARYRKQIPGVSHSCILPGPETRERILS